MIVINLGLELKYQWCGGNLYCSISIILATYHHDPPENQLEFKDQPELITQSYAWVAKDTASSNQDDIIPPKVTIDFA